MIRDQIKLLAGKNKPHNNLLIAWGEVAEARTKAGCIEEENRTHNQIVVPWEGIGTTTFEVLASWHFGTSLLSSSTPGQKGPTKMVPYTPIPRYPIHTPFTLPRDSLPAATTSTLQPRCCHHHWTHLACLTCSVLQAGWKLHWGQPLGTNQSKPLYITHGK